VAELLQAARGALGRGSLAERMSGQLASRDDEDAPTPTA
jgi:hypothetical protein